MQRKLYSYDNFDLVSINSPSFLFLVGALYVGILLGVLSALILRVHSHKIVKALAEHGAADRESAATLEQLGLSGNRFVRSLLKTDSALRRTVLCANEAEFTERKPSALTRFWRNKILRDPLPPATDFEVARFYLPEEKRVSAELRYSEEKHPVRSFILAALGLLALALFTIFVLPELLIMVDNLITQVKPQSKFY